MHNFIHTVTYLRNLIALVTEVSSEHSTHRQTSIFIIKDVNPRNSSYGLCNNFETNKIFISFFEILTMQDILNASILLHLQTNIEPILFIFDIF